MAAQAAGHRAEEIQERPPGTSQGKGSPIPRVVFRAKSSSRWGSWELSVKVTKTALSLGSLAHRRTDSHSLVVAPRRGTKLGDGGQQRVAERG